MFLLQEEVHVSRQGTVLRLCGVRAAVMRCHLPVEPGQQKETGNQGTRR